MPRRGSRRRRRRGSRRRRRATGLVGRALVSRALVSRALDGHALDGRKDLLRDRADDRHADRVAKLRVQLAPPQDKAVWEAYRTTHGTEPTPDSALWRYGMTPCSRAHSRSV